MPKTPNLQKSLDRLVAYLGVQIAKAVAERLGKKIQRQTAAGGRRRKAKAGRPKKAGRKGKAGRRVRGKPKKCSIRGCKNPARSKGLCSKHYQRARYAALHGKKAGGKAKKGGRPRKKIAAAAPAVKTENA